MAQMISESDRTTAHWVAKRLHMHRQTVYRWARTALEGGIAPLREIERLPNGCVVFSKAEIAMFKRERHRF